MPKIRSLLHLCRGLLDRRRLIREHGVEHIANTVGVIPGKPHVCTVRSGFLDTDLNFHMNNAAFLIHSEFARCVLISQPTFPCRSHNCLNLCAFILSVVAGGICWRKEVSDEDCLWLFAHIVSLQRRHQE